MYMNMYAQTLLLLSNRLSLYPSIHPFITQSSIHPSSIFLSLCLPTKLAHKHYVRAVTNPHKCDLGMDSFYMYDFGQVNTSFCISVD